MKAVRIILTIIFSIHLAASLITLFSGYGGAVQLIFIIGATSVVAVINFKGGDSIRYIALGYTALLSAATLYIPFMLFELFSPQSIRWQAACLIIATSIIGVSTFTMLLKLKQIRECA